MNSGSAGLYHPKCSLLLEQNESIGIAFGGKRVILEMHL